jgi:hydroxyethylthiazole kinase-like uncharacterized protein yjeF
MKIFEADELKKADQATLISQGISSIALMERASQACYSEIIQLIDKEQDVFVLCGNGNNGGDGLAIARLLLNQGFRIKVFVVEFSSQATPDFQANLNRLKAECNYEVNYLLHPSDFPSFDHHVIIDALLGTGTSRPVDGILQELILRLNQSHGFLVSIDLPSGMPANGIRNFDFWKNAQMVQAKLTLTFQMPKLAFLLPETGAYVGEWRILNIGLCDDFIENTNTPFFYTELSDLKKSIPQRAKFSHKGSYGHLLLIAGSTGKSGAALLSAKAALRTGCGKLTLCADHSSIQSAGVYLPEAMTIASGALEVEHLPKLNDYNAIAFGPGLGTEEAVQKVLKKLLQDWRGPLLLDADGLNILAENPTWMNWLPQGSILTPHPLELRRLTRNFSGTYFDLMDSASALARKHSVFINLKGSYSCLITPSGRFFFNSSGLPALAKAGTGDVLSGIISALCCMGLSSTESVCLGNYLHGRAGALCLNQGSQHSLLAGEIQGFIGQALKEIEF